MKISELKIKSLPFLFWSNLVVILLIVAPWFLKAGYLFLTDNVWGPVIRLDWTSSYFLFNLTIKGLSYILPLAFLEKIFITAILILILLGGERLAGVLIKRESDIKRSGLIFIIGLFALFNPFVYDRALYGQFSTLLAYGALLFFVAYLLDAFQTLNHSALKRAIIFSGLALMFSSHFIFLLVPFYLLFFLGLYLKRKQIRENGLGRKFWRALAISLFLIIIFNVNWLVALFMNNSRISTFVNQGIGSRDLIAFQTSGETPAKTFGNVLLMSGFWGKEQLRYFDLTDVKGWQKNFLFLSPIIILGAWLSLYKRSREDRAIGISLLVVFVIAVLLAVGIKSPLSRGFSLLLYDHLPFYKGLRESQKWVAVIIPIYLYFLTLGAACLSKTKVVVHNLRLSGFILGALIVMQAPSLLFGFGGQVRSTKYPADWIGVDRFLVANLSKSNSCDESFIFLPWHLYMSFHWIGSVVTNPAPYFFSCPVISGTNMEFSGIYDNSQKPEAAAMESWIKTKGKNGMPAIPGRQPRYIVVTKELDWVGYFWLSKLDYLKPIQETPNFVIYEVKY